MEIDSLSKPFTGVRFVLFGFDPINQRQFRSKLVDGGGVDVGRYSPNCTHVIVDRIVYDDTVCAAARNDGKTLVTSLWVDHSYDIGMPVDTTSVMYRPLKDLNGIPGAKDLVVCLTGYQRQDRDDIMTMVGLMGAQFSKPLVANKVTHLICYKFEGEKYELAKKIKKIKPVNHRWLEDCLSNWELLPEINYGKSGYELEMMEAEAKDSEEEAEDVTLKQFGGRDINNSPHNLKVVMASARESPRSARRVPGMRSNSAVPTDPPVANSKDVLSTPVKVSGSYQASRFDKVNIPEVCGFEDTSFFKDAQLERTPNSTKMENDLAPTSKEAEMHSDSRSKYSLSYSRKTPQKSPSSMSFAKVSSNISSSPEANLDRFKVDVLDINTSGVEHSEEARSATGCVGTPQRGRESCHESESSGTLPQKRMNNLSGASFKSQKMSHNATVCNSSPLANYRNQVLEPKSPLCHPLESDNHLSLPNKGYYAYEAANLNSALNHQGSASSFNEKPSTPDLPSFGTATLETRQNENADTTAPETSFEGIKESILASKPDIGPEAGEPQNQQHHIKVSSSKDRDSEVDKSHRSFNLDLLQGRNDKLIAKPLRKKMVAKKTLGSRHAANQKGSIYLNKSASLNDPAACSGGGEGRTNLELLSGANELETSPSTVSVEAVKQLDAKSVTEDGNTTSFSIESIDDETEAPDEKDEEFAKPLNCEKSEVPELIHKEDIILKMNPGVKDEANDSNVVTHDRMAAKEGMNETELGKAGCGQKLNMDESTSKGKGMKRKMIKGKKRPSGKVKAESVPAEERAEYKKDKDEEGILNENKTKKKGIEIEKSVLHHGSKSSECTASGNKLASSMEAEKENKPVVVRDQISSVSVGKSVLKSMKTPTKINKNIEKLNSNSTPVREALNRLKTEPVCFILSGHRLQRKEFQQVIRRLKGRFCRDSHQWSYQATHFITPDPIRRTEKFFAAAASGRWILKTEYLSACSQAGKFLAEEPYEWHKNGLSEDGAISLEAPRKWRLLRERTGHGAFHGMRVIVYGECIAPPLDTLKRVVKAADGNILATSPPYSRFLKSGVDFAVVSPGMLRVDLWVQEFLKHEIPCVVADYLVEFVCKPGYSLERHVLYNTHAWAEKSFANMLGKAEEILPDLSSPDNRDDNISCQVCGRNDRGEVMLICGDETGSVGCGVGTHIDCCDPPLENVPEDDWFCSKCSRSRINPSKKRKKGTSSSKSK